MILADIRLLLEEWIAEGDQIVVAMDANEDVRAPALASMFQDLGMVEVILHQHTQAQPIATQARNNNGIPIDCMWMTPGLQPETASYLSFDEVYYSDHRCLWSDVPFTMAFGFNPAPIVKPTPRRLQSSDSGQVAQCNKNL